MNVKRASLNSNKNQKLFSQLKYSLNGKTIVIQIEASFGAPLMIRFVSYWSHRICYSNQFIDLHLTAPQILRLLQWWYDHPWLDKCIDIGNWLDKWNHRVPTLLYALSVLSIQLSTSPSVYSQKNCCEWCILPKAPFDGIFLRIHSVQVQSLRQSQEIDQVFAPRFHTADQSNNKLCRSVQDDWLVRARL